MKREEFKKKWLSHLKKPNYSQSRIDEMLYDYDCLLEPTTQPPQSAEEFIKNQGLDKLYKSKIWIRFERFELVELLNKYANQQKAFPMCTVCNEIKCECNG